jgi:hypothetical protein
MASQKVAALTRQDIIKAARNFQWHRQMPKWTTIADGRELPARSLVLDAAGFPRMIDPDYDSYVSSTLVNFGTQPLRLERGTPPIVDLARSESPADSRMAAAKLP